MDFHTIKYSGHLLDGQEVKGVAIEVGVGGRQRIGAHAYRIVAGICLVPDTEEDLDSVVLA